MLRYRKDYGECKIESWRNGHLVELHPCCDLWMRGARTGTVVKVQNNLVIVRIDNHKLPLQRLPNELIRPAY